MLTVMADEAVMNDPCATHCPGCGAVLPGDEGETVGGCNRCVTVLDDHDDGTGPVWPIPSGAQPGAGLSISGTRPEHEGGFKPPAADLTQIVVRLAREASTDPPAVPVDDIALALEPWTIVNEEPEKEESTGTCLLFAVLLFFGPIGWFLLVIIAAGQWLAKAGKTRTGLPYLRLDHATRKPVHLLEIRDAPGRPAGCDVLSHLDFANATLGCRWNGANWEARLSIRIGDQTANYVESLGTDSATVLANAPEVLGQLIAFLPPGTAFHWRVSGLRTTTRVGIGRRGVPDPNKAPAAPRPESPDETLES